MAYGEEEGARGRGGAATDGLFLPDIAPGRFPHPGSYIYSTENLNFCVDRGVLTPFQWGCQ